MNYKSVCIPGQKNWNTSEHNHTVAVRANIIELENSYEIQMQVPGRKKEDITITQEENKLIVQAPRVEFSKEVKSLLHGFNLPAIKNVFTLGKGVNPESITAHVENGILTIQFQKSDYAIAKTITVQ